MSPTLSTSTRRTIVLVGSGVAALAVVLAIVLSVFGSGSARQRDGVGRPMLLITSAADPFSSYYGEILHAEGFSSFETVDLGALTEANLQKASVALLPALELTQPQTDLISGWVRGGGNLVAVRPDAKLADTVGLSRASGEERDGYLRVDTTLPPGQGITSETIQFHGTADRYEVRDEARTIATLYSDATKPTPYPAVTLREVPDASGRAVAFTYDLARSIVLTRQGNPAWAGKERDGIPPIRPNELFEGVKEPDFVDMAKVAIPQADEQQRLLANILLQLTGDRDLQVRSWYFPKGAKAVLVMAVDDHSPSDRARAALAFQEDQSPPSCSVADWECIRSTSLMYTNGNLTDAELKAYHEKGFDFGIHVNTGCRDWTPESLTTAYTDELASFRTLYPSQPDQVANRIHCVAWSDYVSAARIGQNFGLRVDLDYYYWPGQWVRNRPGFFTGSGVPMRFADLDGTLIDTYQVPSHLVNESGMTYPAAIETLLDRALGPLGYYGAFGTHYDYTDWFDRQLVAAGKARGIPMVSAAQLLTWLDARAAASFTPVAWNGTTATFSATVPSEARELMRGTIPASTTHGVLTTLTKDGQDVPFTTETIKGVRYGMFTATTGEYKAGYAPDDTPPSLVSTTPANGETLSMSTGVTATFDEQLACATVSEASVHLLAPSGTGVPAQVACESDGTAVRIRPTGKLAAGKRYQLRFDPTVTDLAGNPLQGLPELAFPAGAATTSLWSRTRPDGVAIATDDRAAVELGIKFSTKAKGRATGIWFYKPSDDLDRHTVTLWTADGARLATARSSKESADGWQFAKLPKTVTLKPGAGYVASFRAPRGQYAYVAAGLTNAVNNGALSTPASGGRYRYGDGVPNQTSAANYLVDVAFATD